MATRVIYVAVDADGDWHYADPRYLDQCREAGVRPKTSREWMRLPPCGWIEHEVIEVPSPSALARRAFLAGTLDLGLEDSDPQPLRARLELLPAEPLEAIARVFDFGTQKYEVDDWLQHVGDPEWRRRRLGSLLRHALAFRRGELTDPETGESHLAHLGANVLFLLYHEETRTKP